MSEVSQFVLKLEEKQTKEHQAILQLLVNIEYPGKILKA